MGYQALAGNGITAKILFLLRDKSFPAADRATNPLHRIARRRMIWLFVAIELVGFAATFAITQTVAAVGFPVFIFALIPVRALLLPRWFTPQELGLLDAPTASPFTMESVGGTYGVVEEERDEEQGVEEKDGAGGESSGTDGRNGRSGGGGLFENDRAGGSQQDRAEMGENKSARLSGSDGGSGVNRRHNGKTGE